MTFNTNATSNSAQGPVSNVPGQYYPRTLENLFLKDLQNPKEKHNAKVS